MRLQFSEAVAMFEQSVGNVEKDSVIASLKVSV